jgi:hypothetical protein
VPASIIQAILSRPLNQTSDVLVALTMCVALTSKPTARLVSVNSPTSSAHDYQSEKIGCILFYSTMHFDDLLFQTAGTRHYRYGLELHKQMLARLWDRWGEEVEGRANHPSRNLLSWSTVLKKLLKGLIFVTICSTIPIEYKANL